MILVRRAKICSFLILVGLIEVKRLGLTKFNQEIRFSGSVKAKGFIDLAMSVVILYKTCKGEATREDQF